MTIIEAIKSGKPILDACCGSKMFWFDKNNPNVLFADIREENHVLCDGRKLEITPDLKMDFKDLKMDFKNMPFDDCSFKLVVFDPPHLKSAGENGWQAKKYGSLGDDWKTVLKNGVDECFRVLDDFGVLIFKWNEHSFKVSEVIDAINRKPLFGHRTMQNNKTIWMAFMKIPKTSSPTIGL